MRAGCAEKDLEQLTTAVLIIWKELQGLQEPPEDTGIVIEGAEVLNELIPVTSACALLLRSDRCTHFLVCHTDFGLCTAQDY